MVHDSRAGRLAALRCKEIAAQIEEQCAWGGEGLLDKDQYLLEINILGNEETSVEAQEYWLLAITAARIACQLTEGGNARDGTDYG